MAVAPPAGTAMADIKSGQFVRQVSSFRNFISADGPFLPEADRYVLYVSYACPWASRTLAVRALKGLEHVISVVVVDPVLARTRPDDQSDTHMGWMFSGNQDSFNGCKSIRDLYLLADPEYQGRFTVPVLWDLKTKAILNNESSEIIVMLNDQFNALARNAALDLYPAHLREEIEATNKWTYDICNGVYRSGFATTQDAYDEAVQLLFATLDRAELLLEQRRFLVGNELTLADIRLFVTLVRFDEVYHGHFKCNKRLLQQYLNLFNYTKDVFQFGGGQVSSTVNMEHIKSHYHRSHLSINQYQIVPIGPNVDFNSPHDRNRFLASAVPQAIASP